MVSYQLKFSFLFMIRVNSFSSVFDLLCFFFSYYSQEERKRCWIWLSLWIRACKLSLLVVDKVKNKLSFFYMILVFEFLMLVYLLLAVTGTLKGYDQLLNLVLDAAVESVRGISLSLSLCIFFMYMNYCTT